MFSLTAEYVCMCRRETGSNKNSSSYLLIMTPKLYSSNPEQSQLEYEKKPNSEQIKWKRWGTIKSQVFCAVLYENIAAGLSLPEHEMVGA